MANFMEKLRDLVDERNRSRLFIPRKMLFTLMLIDFLLFAAIAGLWHGIWIFLSVFLCFPAAYFVHFTAKLWCRYYSVVTFAVLTVFEFAAAVAILYFLTR